MLYLVMTNQGLALWKIDRCHPRQRAGVIAADRPLRGLIQPINQTLLFLLAEFYCHHPSVYWHICVVFINSVLWVKKSALTLSLGLRLSVAHQVQASSRLFGFSVESWQPLSDCDWWPFNLTCLIHSTEEEFKKKIAFFSTQLFVKSLWKSDLH